MCVGAGMVSDALAVIDQMRSVHNSKLPVAIMHCDELHHRGIASFSALPQTHIVNICEHKAVMGMDETTMRHRLRSWFCKVAAILFAPFTEVMAVDMDTIWFDNPDSVFETEPFIRTGTLFMRDRLTHDSTNRAFFNQVLTLVHSINTSVELTPAFAADHLASFGVNFFLRALANAQEPALNNVQESSIVLIDKSRHENLLLALEKLLPTFQLGYGDKEIYWIAALIAGEDVSFEPFLSTLYGPCGLMMHYHPRDFSHPDTARPLYLNAEWLLEKLNNIGQG